MPPDQVYKGMTYKDLIEEWWNWAYSEDPTPSNDTDPIFLSGNIAKSAITRENLSSDSIDAIVGFNEIQSGQIPVRGDRAVFFPVYNTLFLVKDPYERKPLRTRHDCKIAAKREFSSMSKAWATYTYAPPESQKQEPKVIVADGLWNNYIESSITLVGSINNQMKREPNYRLKDEKAHEGADVGIYLLMRNFSRGKYTIDFGGISKNNFFTRAIYDLDVDRESVAMRKESESNVSDISGNMTKYQKQ